MFACINNHLCVFIVYFQWNFFRKVIYFLRYTKNLYRLFILIWSSHHAKFFVNLFKNSFNNIQKNVFVDFKKIYFNFVDYCYESITFFNWTKNWKLASSHKIITWGYIKSQPSRQQIQNPLKKISNLQKPFDAQKRNFILISCN